MLAEAASLGGRALGAGSDPEQRQQAMDRLRPFPLRPTDTGPSPRQRRSHPPRATLGTLLSLAATRLPIDALISSAQAALRARRRRTPLGAPSIYGHRSAVQSIRRENEHAERPASGVVVPSDARVRHTLSFRGALTGRPVLAVSKAAGLSLLGRLASARLRSTRPAIYEITLARAWGSGSSLLTCLKA